MCGICGAIGPATRRTAAVSEVLAMRQALTHRGPDAEGITEGEGAILGHRRLSIIDLSGGAQPMEICGGELRIAFNGEIFNYLELREELGALGHVFTTAGDTEVILRAYREWGHSCVSRFNGQWAFALLDERRRQVVLSRDPVGIRPLYYTVAQGALLFASEVKALFRHPAVDRRLSGHGIAQTFTFWAPLAPHTAFEGIRQVEPGTTIRIPTDTRLINVEAFVPERHFSIEFESDPVIRGASLQENVERFRRVFEQSVRLRFTRSDVPVGAYLSGGIDSSVTTAIVASTSPSPLETFSIAFEDSEFDESAYQMRVAKALGTSHHTVRVSYGDIGDAFGDAVYHGEQPILRTAPTPLFLLSRLVRENGYKVVVTGEGADEMLAGYDIFREALVRRFVARDPDSARRRDILLHLYPWMERSPAKAPAFAKAFFSQGAELDDPALSHRPRWKTSSALLRMLRPEFGVAAPGVVEAELLKTLPATYGTWDPLEQAQYLEIRTLLSGYILAAQGDRMLMAHSVEGRFPFLDPEVMRLAASLPPRHKLMGLDEKHILKRAYGHLLPREIAERPKQPYRAPDAAAFFAGGRSPEWFSELLSERSIEDAGIFHLNAVSTLLAKCRRTDGIGMSNSDNMRLAAITSTMVLYDRLIQGN